MRKPSHDPGDHLHRCIVRRDLQLALHEEVNHADIGLDADALPCDLNRLQQTPDIPIAAELFLQGLEQRDRPRIAPATGGDASNRPALETRNRLPLTIALDERLTRILVRNDLFNEPPKG